MKLPVNEPGLLEIIVKVSRWHTASGHLESAYRILGTSVERQARQYKIDSQHDGRIGSDQEICTSTVLEPNLCFSTDVCGAIEAADMIFIAVNTPSKVNHHHSQ